MIKDYIFFSSKYCTVCKENKSKDLICDECIEKLEYIDGYKELEDGICLYPLFYNKFTKEIIKRYKYYNETHLAKVFSNILYDFFIKKDINIDYISYIPMYKSDEYERGYNQSYLLANELSKKMGIDLIDITVKIKSTKHQNKLNRKERLENLSDSLEIIKDLDINNKNILVIDDIVTTGSTFNSFSKEVLDEYDLNLIYLAIASSKIEE